MKLLARLKEWLFYGHVWIALAAAGLSFWTLAIARSSDVYQPWWPEGARKFILPPLLTLFFATLGVYTLHRFLSFRLSPKLPETKRYQLVKRHPNSSLLLGCISIAISGLLIFRYTDPLNPLFAIAFGLTAFYLIPIPGWKRLRDLPYLKVVFVATAWTIMTVHLPLLIANILSVGPCGGWIFDIHPDLVLLNISLTRFLFCLAVALLFDLRDVELDRSHGVKTFANSYPVTLKAFVPFLFLACATITAYTLVEMEHLIYPAWLMASAYLIGIPVAFMTYSRTDEDWYAIVVNGLLLLPPIAAAVAAVFFGH
ncbi:hypothetical protein [Lewinella sp. 4G2]|uniref:hypothetical protein n=1 Tax=Lewinella sp. 4G2 TaxID=1803372 RepID=UPI0007B4D429|nr:hypothetical protein [Lewinella sp. 4G2]OAV44073.1 hypothetical protein A3850_005980 [Lewinella sp. 4G2]